MNRGEVYLPMTLVSSSIMGNEDPCKVSDIVFVKICSSKLSHGLMWRLCDTVEEAETAFSGNQPNAISASLSTTPST